jgi:hypothetical protein
VFGAVVQASDGTPLRFPTDRVYDEAAWSERTPPCWHPQLIALTAAVNRVA